MAQFEGATFLDALVVPDVWAAYIEKNSTKTNRLLNSGVVTADDVLGSRLTEEGQVINIPVLNDLYGDPQAWNDKTDIAVSSVTSGKHNAVKMYQAKAFGETDFSEQVSGVNVASHIATRFSNYWNRQDERLDISLLHNAFLIPDLKDAKGYNIGSPKDLNAGDFIAAMTRMGDVSDPALTRLLMNSAVVGAMREQNLIDTVQPSVGGASIQTYNGIPIVTDDQIPIDESGVTRIYALTTGAIRYSSTMASKNGVEVVRDGLSYGGQSALVNRRIVSMHLNGLGFNMTNWKEQLTVQDFEGNTPLYEIVSDPRTIGAVAYEFKIDPKFAVKGIHYNFTEENDAPKATKPNNSSGSSKPAAGDGNSSNSK
ncbi:MAG: hypothetical protein [Bacteriophage sp.]|nr:MAG: hypothetical protein [Bacteriophage sp.]